MSAYPDPRDPRVQEDIQEAVQRARDSALGSHMSEQDLFNAASGYLGVEQASAPGIDVEIRREVRRQSGTDWTVEDRRGSHAESRSDPEPEYRGSAPAADPVLDVTVDHWCTDAEIEAMQNYAPFDGNLARDRYDPTCPSEFYRGYLTALVALLQSVGPGDSMDRYRSVVTRIDDVLKTWSGHNDQRSGAAFAMTNAWQYSTAGVAVPQIVAFVRGEIACLAECFRTARWHGQ
ncbi:hypothetical protein NDR87_15070 [Nocardia sp. CDC159]|uniref:Uncharacterized protein n=1 Tax=Nocardia pulmonis TaxID=2951408 RepID=A0A9X2ECB4_9NOCA|nr:MULTISPECIES: hypothetical protein [Nocardia]MCM6775588.1 hypothetical protein [Nocardia pulmonis]MCM6787678.1 hypothetical protein [Nocardia sp. CDC159]